MNRYRSEDSVSYSLGMSLTIEALKHASEYVKKVILSEKAARNEQFGYLLKLCEDNNVETEYDDRLIGKLSVKENCYCIGIFEKFQRELCSDRHIVLYDFSDFGELGTVLRSAISFDLKDIVLIGNRIDYFDPRCIRASMGSIFHCNIVTYDTLDEYLYKYRDHHIFPFVSAGNKKLEDLKLKSPYSIVISQDYEGLDERYPDGFCIAHSELKEISLSIRSSIILCEVYNQNRSL